MNAQIVWLIGPLALDALSILTRSGYSVQCANDVTDVQARMPGGAPPDPAVIIVLEARPSGSTEEDVPRLRQLAPHGRIVLLFRLSAAGAGGFRQDFLRAQADDLLLHPIAPSELVARLRADESTPLADRLTADLATRASILQQLAVERDRLMAVVAHDMRTPLNTLVMGAELLARISARDATRDSLVGSFVRATSALEALLDDLVDAHHLIGNVGGGLENLPLAEPPPSTTGGQLGPQEADALLGQALRDCNARANKAQVRLEHAPASEGFDVAGDHDRTLRAIRKVIAYAIAQGRSGDRIETSVHRNSPAEVEVRIVAAKPASGGPLPTDDAPGTPFWRMDRGDRAKTSLGLWWVSMALRAMGGRLTLTSGPQTVTYALGLPAFRKRPDCD